MMEAKMTHVNDLITGHAPMYIQYSPFYLFPTLEAFQELL